MDSPTSIQQQDDNGEGKRSHKQGHSELEPRYSDLPHHFIYIGDQDWNTRDPKKSCEENVRYCSFFWVCLNDFHGKDRHKFAARYIDGSTRALPPFEHSVPNTPLPKEPHEYKYTPICHKKQGFRVIMLHPKSFGDRICVEFIDSTLSEPITYEAISYVWGKTDKHVDIMCRRVDFWNTKKGNFYDTHTGVLKVSNTVHEILQSMRFEKGVRFLWIDGLCINQADLNERADQVRIMDRIYNKAIAVLVWLPETFSNCTSGQHHRPQSLGAALMSAIRKSHVMWHHQKTGFRKFNKPPSSRCLLLPESWNKQTPRYSETEFAALHHLLNSTWFTRVWTLQEFVLAKAVILKVGDRDGLARCQSGIRCLRASLRV